METFADFCYDVGEFSSSIGFKLNWKLAHPSLQSCGGVVCFFYLLKICFSSLKYNCHITRTFTKTFFDGGRHYLQ